MAAGQTGPAGELFLTANGGDSLVSVHGVNESFHSTIFGSEGPIAVYGDVRTTGTSSGALGASYGLDGVFTGGIYSSNVPSSAMDATTDGHFNYVLNDQGGVFATDRSFQSPNEIFVTGPSGATGIAYDPFNKSLWIAASGVITDYDMTGNLLSTFAAALSEPAALAFDNKDGTLWLGSNETSGVVLSQYRVDGTLRQIYGLTNVTSVNGMEFNLGPAPEPASLLALGAGVLGLVRRARKAPRR